MYTHESLKKLIPQKQRLRLTIRGAVQGVGFRPFIYKLATELKLTGWVNNSASGVFVEVEGSREVLETFLQRLEPEKPPRSHIHSLEPSWLDAVNYPNFEIRPSVDGEKTALILPDIATCPDCLTEIFDPNNRRYRYPFTNCTNCGPRYSIIAALPYDRRHTTMQPFEMCPHCQAEYENPLNRRFHAQPNACPQCGPHLELWDPTGARRTGILPVLQETAAAIRDGKIVAIKGLGGFHLIADAGNRETVELLRLRKRRSQKPFALMYPNLELVKQHCQVSPVEERLLLSPESPIVLLEAICASRNPVFQKNRVSETEVSGISTEMLATVAPGNPYLGVMLPYTPLHHLLMAELDFPVVATSGNLSDEPICIDEHEALERLGGIADLFLVHNRSIARPIDDSVVRIILGREMVLRRARGYAPLPISVPTKGINSHSQTSILAVGGHLKNTVAARVQNQIFISQHIGDLETTAAFECFQQIIASFQKLYEFKPQIVACDAHPDYLSSKFALDLNLPVIAVQHHYAHILSCMAENEIEAPVLGVAWDGTGYGLDGTIWGGEFLLINETSFQRVAHFRCFNLPGGDKAVKEPRRVALGLLYELFGDEVFSLTNLLPVAAFADKELSVIKTMLQKKINVPTTSSAGRLFDAVSALIGIKQIVSFEGQGAMELEFACEQTEDKYSFKIEKNQLGINAPLIVNWEPMILEIIEDILRLSKGAIAAKFHNTLVAVIVEVAKIVGTEKVVLSGGCFQNKYLIEKTVEFLQREKFRPYWHQRVPPNDGGIALGQILAAGRINN